jgi:hypothetical protein
MSAIVKSNHGPSSKPEDLAHRFITSTVWDSKPSLIRILGLYRFIVPWGLPGRRSAVCGDMTGRG